MRSTSVLLALALSSATFAQYSGPESVEYDPVGNRYFVSNTGNGTIVERAQNGSTSVFASLSGGGPHGLEIQGDTLFACNGGRVRGFSLADGAQVFNLDLSGSFNNGITTDGRHLYVTDFSARKIYKVDPTAGSFTTLVSNTGNTPNGIVYDPMMDRLWVVGWGSNAFIRSYDRNTGAQLSTFTTALGNIDGVSMTCSGDLLVASWSPARITRFETTFTEAPVTVLSTTLSSPADIDYDAVNEVVCIPNSGNNTVTLHPYACSGVGVPELQRSMVAAPVPATDRLWLLDGPTVPTPYLLYGNDGAVRGRGVLLPGAPIEVADLAPGIYLLALPERGGVLRFVKA